MHSILDNLNMRLQDESNRNSEGPDRLPLTVEEKRTTIWADDVTRRTSYTKRAFPPWNIAMMGREFI